MAVVEALSSNVPVALSTEVAVSSIVQERGAGTVAAYYIAATPLPTVNVFASQFRSVFLGDVDEASS